MWKWAFLKKIIKNINKRKFRDLVFFMSAWRIWNHLYFNSKKNCTQNPYFLQKFDFCIFEPKNCKMIENSYNAPLNFSPL